MARQIAKAVSLYFTSQDLNHDLTGDDGEVILTGFGGLKNVGSLGFVFIFDENERTCALFTRDYISVPQDKIQSLYGVLNDLNVNYRWAKFTINEEGTVRVETDGVLDLDTCGAECEELMGRLTGIADEAYPVIMKAIWS